MEAGLVSSESDLPFRAIPAAALRGRAPWTLARNSGTLARGTLMARRLIAAERPKAILGTGGYVCVPLFLAARAAGVPAAIYLPDVVPGLAVRFLARLATRIACSVADSLAHFDPREQAKVVVTGYPVRRELFEQDRGACRAAFGLAAGLPALLVYGGSRGARNINRAIEALLEHLLPIAQVIHVCGREADETFLRAAAARLPGQLQARYRLYPYLFTGKLKIENEELRMKTAQFSISNSQFSIPTMVQAFGAADLVVCRSGASTLGELPAARLPALLVPLPITGIHQDANANYLARHGAAITVRDEEMLGGARPEDGPLFRHIRRLLEQNEERTQMEERSQALARPDAARSLATVLLDLATRRGPA